MPTMMQMVGFAVVFSAFIALAMKMEALWSYEGFRAMPAPSLPIVHRWTRPQTPMHSSLTSALNQIDLVKQIPVQHSLYESVSERIAGELLLPLNCKSRRCMKVGLVSFMCGARFPGLR